MDVLIGHDGRFDRTPDGHVWYDGTLDHTFWDRYLDVFDHVCVVARVRDVPNVPRHCKRVDADRVHFHAIPYYMGPWQYARRYFAVRRAIRAGLDCADAAILRVPGAVCNLLAAALRSAGRPYAVEVIGDPYDMFAPGCIRSAVRPLMRWSFPRQLRRQCAEAAAAAYVTRETLQRRYPPAPDAVTTSYSSIHLTDADFVDRPRETTDQGSIRLIFIGSLSQHHKALDVLIDAVGRMVRDGVDLELAVVGDGRLRPELEALAHSHGLAERAHFLGQLPAGPTVHAELDRADVLVLPSKTEGLPRVLIEGMARGLPCIGTRIAGIPELLPEEDLVPPGDAAALATKIAEFAHDPARRAAAASRNLATAREYHTDNLRPRRRAFYEATRDIALHTMTA